jgi:hypothetical protein
MERLEASKKDRDITTTIHCADPDLLTSAQPSAPHKSGHVRKGQVRGIAVFLSFYAYPKLASLAPQKWIRLSEITPLC